MNLQQLKDQAVAAAEAGNFLAAAAHFADALRQTPHDAELHEQHAQCLMELEQYDAALAAAEQATGLKPSWPDAWVTLARARLNSGHLQSAQQAFIKALELDPAHPEAQAEHAEVEQLLQQQLGVLVGLPKLKLCTNPLGCLGPGGVVWEAGVQLAQLLVSLASRDRDSNAAPPLSPAEAPAAICKSCTSTAEHTSLAVAATGAAAAAAVQPESAELAGIPATLLPAVNGARVLEIGAGTGIVGITAAALGAHVTLTDLPELQPLLRANIAANEQHVAAAGGSVYAAVLDWSTQHHCSQPSNSTSNHRQEQQVPGKELEQSMLSLHSWDWACGADLVFNAGQVAPVVQLITTLLRGQQANCHVSCCNGFLLAHKQRHAAVDSQLLNACREAALTVQQVTRQQPSSAARGIDVVHVWWIQANDVV